MGLVDYSDSDSESETPQAKTSAADDTKRAQKLINRSATGKILVQLPGAAKTNADDGPPAKRARLDSTTEKAGASSSRFSGFSSFLPPPKNVAVSATRSAGTGKAARIGVHLKTSAEAAFSRTPVDGDEDEHDEGYGREPTEGGPHAGSGFGGLNLPAPKGRAGPTIPEGQKPEEEVQLVGKPLIFRPLSVGRKPAMNKKKRNNTGNAATKQGDPTPQTAAFASSEQKKKKVSLFAADDDDETTHVPMVAYPADPAYPAFSVGIGDDDESDSPWTSSYAEYAQQCAPPSAAAATASSVHANGASLSSIADELHLSAKDRRELFGRGGAAAADLAQRQQPGRAAGAKVVSFDMAREYSSNEALRAAGEQQLHNPVRAIQPGKHSLRQVVNMVQNNQDALEESFAKHNNNRREAAGRYGWR